MLFLLLAAEQQDRLSADTRVDVDDHGGRRAGVGKLFDADREGERVQACPTELAWDEHAHEAGFSGGGDRLIREAVLPIDRGRQRLHNALREFAHGGPKACVLGREFEIQLRR